MQTPLDIGADVSKDYVIVACAKQSLPSSKLVNKRAALLPWLKSLPAGSRIGMEATGTYHELLATLALRLGFVVYVLNASPPLLLAIGALALLLLLSSRIALRQVRSIGSTLIPLLVTVLVTWPLSSPGPALLLVPSGRL